MKRGKWNMRLSDSERIRLTSELGKEVKYRCPAKIVYIDPRTGRTKTIVKDYLSDGATGARDINSEAWWVHDGLCDDGTWDDGTPYTNLQASAVVRDILLRDGFWYRANFWFAATLAFGGGKARENGMW